MCLTTDRPWRTRAPEPAVDSLPAGVRLNPGPACPHEGAGDGVKLAETVGCTIASGWTDMCPCRAVLGGWDDEWKGYDSEGNALPAGA